jgi:hypothetical protein
MNPQLANVLQRLSTLPPGVGPAVLRALADAWANDPQLPNEIAAGNYEAAIEAIAKSAPGSVNKILAIVLASFHR